VICWIIIPLGCWLVDFFQTCQLNFNNLIKIEDVAEGWVPGVSLLVEEACDLLDYLFPLIVGYMNFLLACKL
jgi:hypothetical protein